MDILDKIKSCDTMPKLNAIRPEIVNHMKSKTNGLEVQKAFIIQLNKLKRVPLKDREGW